MDNATLFKDLQRSNSELMLAYEATLAGWSAALDLRDRETEGHTQRVTKMTMDLAEAMGIPAVELVHIRRGALLHDIGKMGVPDNILLKPDKLNEEEWQHMRMHAVYAYNLLSNISYLRDALDIPYCHHEKWNGTGYPRGLKGEEIPMAARIISVVDAFDSMTLGRPYRQPMRSVLGVLALLIMVFSMVWLLVMREENLYTSLSGMWMPFLAGTTLAFLMITAVDLLRYRLTGTWGGFPLG